MIELANIAKGLRMACAEGRKCHEGAQASSAHRSTLRRTLILLRSPASGHRCFQQFALARASDMLASPSTAITQIHLFLHSCLHTSEPFLYVVTFVYTLGTNDTGWKVTLIREDYLAVNLSRGSERREQGRCLLGFMRPGGW